MLAIRRLYPDDWSLYRELRLTALEDSPTAFGSTLARERAFADEAWRERLERSGGDAGCALVATLDGVPRALVRSLPDRCRADGAELFQMWVAPAARGRGVGRALVYACAEWASSRGFVVLSLDCTRDNASARRLYERCGFVVTGASELPDGHGAAAIIRMELDFHARRWRPPGSSTHDLERS